MFWAFREEVQIIESLQDLSEATPHSVSHSSEGDMVTKPSEPSASSSVTTINSALSIPITSDVLLMTCQITVETPHGEAKALALLDTGSSASFVSECLAQSLRLT